MSQKTHDPSADHSDETVSWGPKLFYGVLIAVLIFFWWFVIYSHGVVATH
ncbi:MAG: hypothetical protein H8E21_10065 [Gammaproteobacteria bacterium]|nr:hypothetical protein [Gammaproteobacteria bacterium]MBL6999304.1 hypothetical protein [Gammaproteobacteria bacterium]